MVNDEYIKSRLQQWAEWSLMRESGALGYPRECPYTRMMARSGASGFFSPDIDSESMEVEVAVRELPEYLRETVRVFYIQPGTVEQKARALACSRNTIYLRLSCAYPLIVEMLHLRFRKKRLTL